MYDVEWVNVTKRFGATVAVNNLSLAVERGQFLTLLGPSGCGKTTTLNMLAGFLTPDEGEVRLAGQVVNHLPPNRRDTAMVFQQYALFPHMTVFDNIAFGLRMRKVPKAEIARRVNRALDIVRLAGLGDRRISQLSGGQQQRVALARAIVVEPTVLLMDEPLSNLDLKLREQLRLEIKNIQKQLGLTAIYVTHDQGEALVMSDQIAVMNNGVIEQLGDPIEIYERPRTPFVASFIGTSNFLSATVEARNSESITLRLKDGTILDGRMASDDATSRNEQVLVAIRPEHVLVSEGEEHGTANDSKANKLVGVLTQVVYLGSARRYTVGLRTGEMLTIEEPNRETHTRVELGQQVALRVNPDKCLVMKPGPTAEQA